MMNTQQSDKQTFAGLKTLCSVLVVDDETDFISTLVKRLQRRGVECEGALSGEEAVEKSRARKFDLVLLDMKLPDMDGNRTLAEIKKIRPDTRVIILTGHASARDGIEGIKNGAADYLMKPVEFESLFEKVLSVACGAKYFEDFSAIGRVKQ